MLLPHLVAALGLGLLALEASALPKHQESADPTPTPTPTAPQPGTPPPPPPPPDGPDDLCCGVLRLVGAHYPDLFYSFCPVPTTTPTTARYEHEAKSTSCADTDTPTTTIYNAPTQTPTPDNPCPPGNDLPSCKVPPLGVGGILPRQVIDLSAIGPALTGIATQLCPGFPVGDACACLSGLVDIFP